MPCFLKMPALSPRCITAVSQLPRWPMATFTRSSALAGAPRAHSSREMVSRRFIPRPPFLLSLDRVDAAEFPDQCIHADRDYEQHDEQRIHARHVEGRISVDDEKADPAV